MNTEMLCLTVKTKKEGCPILIFLEGLEGPDDLIETVKRGLRAEYRGMNDVASWCFHGFEHTPHPGDFRGCTTEDREDWLIRLATAAFGWEARKQIAEGFG